MSSVLTSTTSKSSYFYLGLILLATLGGWYLFKLKDPSISVSLQKQAFRLNYSAFKNGIIFANYQFIIHEKVMLKKALSLNNEQPSKLKFLYNEAGFPVALNKQQKAQNKPLSSQDCLDIWQNVLGPLQPKISLKPADKNYWVSLSKNNDCVFHHELLKSMQIRYKASSGKVILTDINS